MLRALGAPRAKSLAEGEAPMPSNLKVFEWLVYIAAAIDLVGSLISRQPWPELISDVVIIAIIVALAWAAARHAQRWAAWVLAFGTAVLAAAMIADLSGATWLADGASLAKHEKVEGIIEVVLLVAALYFYFFGDRKTA